MDQVVEQMAMNLLQDAWRKNASDIHLVPRSSDAIVRYRIDGRLHLYQVCSKEKCKRLISHFKFLSSMDIGERRKPQDGSLIVQVDKDTLQLRLSTLPNTSDESLVLRIHPQNTSKPLASLSLFPSYVKKLHSLLSYSHGLILSTGPTGSGKTTTLYALLEELQHRYNANIITIEDPVEKKNDNFIQLQVNTKAGMTFETGLTSILRHDPDIIMIGEIRDAQTAKIAIQASLTGHLVLSTLHTRSTKGAIYRLLELGIPLHDLQQSLVGITTQKLVRVTCPYCMGECSLGCENRKKGSRAAIYEFLSEADLDGVMREVKGETVSHTYKTLPNLLNKAYALGFIGGEEVNSIK